nr:immunoglobulin heavy chain junction region [Mus musculus]
CARWILFGDFW